MTNRQVPRPGFLLADKNYDATPVQSLLLQCAPLLFLKTHSKLNPEQTYPLFYSELMPLMPNGSFYFVDNVRKLPTLFEKHVNNGDVDKALQLLATTIDDLEVFLQERF